VKEFVYIHTPLLETWQSVYSDVISFIPDRLKETTYSVIVGEGRSDETINPIHFRNYGCDYDEVATLQAIWNHARYAQEECAFYYLHLKGVTRRGMERENCDEWRRMMCHFLFGDTMMNQQIMGNHDCIGSLLLTNPLHYQGNFFVTKSSHIRKLPFPLYHHGHRYHETWITSCEGKYVDLLGDRNLANMYLEKVDWRNWRVSPAVKTQIKFPHGTTFLM